MKRIFVLLSLCVVLDLTKTLSDDSVLQRNKEIILSKKLKLNNSNFFGVLLVPYIICFFAATGFWPHFPKYMQSSVNEMGQQIFSQSDEHIQNYCKGKFLFNGQQSYRPIIYKGIFFPTIVKDDTFKPITEWVHTTTAQATTKEMTLATIKESTLGTTPEVVTMTTTTEPPTTTTERPTTTTAEIPTTTETTTQLDVSVVTFDPNKPSQAPTCNCSQSNQPKLIKTIITSSPTTTTTAKTTATKRIKTTTRTRTTPSTTTTTSLSTTTSAEIKIDVKNVISFIDRILSYFNLTRSDP